MQAASLDILERAQLPPVQARAIVQVMELEVSAHHEHAATKEDIALVRMEIQQAKAELIKWMVGIFISGITIISAIAYLLLSHPKV